VQKTTQQNKSE